jgi:hypothetical protein
MPCNPKAAHKGAAFHLPCTACMAKHRRMTQNRRTLRISLRHYETAMSPQQKPVGRMLAAACAVSFFCFLGSNMRIPPAAHAHLFNSSTSARYFSWIILRSNSQYACRRS